MRICPNCGCSFVPDGPIEKGCYQLLKLVRKGDLPMLDKRKNPHTGREEYCLVSISSGKVLEWYGPKRPTEEQVKESEARVNWFKHKGGK